MSTYVVHKANPRSATLRGSLKGPLLSLLFSHYVIIYYSGNNPTNLLLNQIQSD